MANTSITPAQCNADTVGHLLPRTVLNIAMEEEQSNARKSKSQKAIRLIELLLVTGVAFAATIFVSVYSLLFGAFTSNAQGGHILVFYGLIYELIAVAVLCYVLFRQGRSPREIGLTFSWKDIPLSLALSSVAYIAFYVC
jgi:drug/metabolite transporter (DMT)-like permease